MQTKENKMQFKKTRALQEAIKVIMESTSKNLENHNEKEGKQIWKTSEKSPS